MSSLIPTNALKTIYANKPAPQPTTHELQDRSPSQASDIDPNEPGHHTTTDFVLGRSAIVAIIVVTIIIIVLIVVVVVKAGQIASRKGREKKEKEEKDKAAGIVSAAWKGYRSGGRVLPLALAGAMWVLVL